jgi:uncharacterized protein
MTKEDVRAAAEQLGLPNHDKPASPCLASRIPYGQEVTPAKLSVVERGEAFVRSEFGVRECRVRHFGRQARVEVPQSFVSVISRRENRQRIEEFLRSLGFEEVVIDPDGFRSGKLNDALTSERSPQVVPVPKDTTASRRLASGGH